MSCRSPGEWGSLRAARKQAGRGDTPEGLKGRQCARGRLLLFLCFNRRIPTDGPRTPPPAPAAPPGAQNPKGAPRAGGGSPSPVPPPCDSGLPNLPQTQDPGWGGAASSSTAAAGASAPLPAKPPRLSSTQIWEANWTIKLSSEETRSLETAGIYKREIFAFKTFKLYMAGQAKPRGRVDGREVLGPWGAEAGGWGERQHRLLGVHGGPEAGSFEFLCHRRHLPPHPQFL